MNKDKINSLKEAIKLNSQSLFSQRDSIKSAIESLNVSTLKQAMALQTSGYLSTMERMKKEMSSLMKPHGLGSVFAEQESLKASMLGVGYMSKIERMKKEMSSLMKPHGLGSVFAEQESLKASMLGVGYMSKIERMKKEMSSLMKPHGLGSIFAEQESLKASMLGVGYMLEIERMKKEMSSFMKPHGLGSVLEQAKSLQSSMAEIAGIGHLLTIDFISNKKIVEKFQTLDISEAIRLNNEFNNTLKPYDNDVSPVNIKWFSFDEVRKAIIDLITLYMFVVYFVNPSLEIKDLELINNKQKLWLQEEFKKQTQELNNLVKVKKNELYYITIRDNIILRTNPYIKKSTAKARLDKDVKLLVLLRKDNWLNVEYFDEDKQVTQVGWVHIKNLKKVGMILEKNKKKINKLFSKQWTYWEDEELDNFGKIAIGLSKNDYDDEDYSTW